MGRPQTPIPDQPPPSTSSVVIVSFNCAGALRRCLTALEHSTGRSHFEVIVVDNGSRDESARLEDEFPGITFLRLPRNFGLTRARNIGTRTATGEFTLYLDPHVEVEPGTVAALVAALEAHPEAAAVNALLLDPAGNVVTQVRPLPSPAELYRIWKHGVWPQPQPVSEDTPEAVDWIPAEATMVRALFLRGMNYFDEHFSQHWSDLELCFQIHRAGRKNLLFPFARGVRHTDDAPQPPAAARGQLSADEALGAAAYAGKHFGWFAGLRFRIAAAFAALAGLLGSLLRARDLRFHMSRFGAIVFAQRIDGSQTSL